MRLKTSHTNIKKPYLFPFKKKINFMCLDLSIEGVQSNFTLKALVIITMLILTTAVGSR